MNPKTRRMRVRPCVLCGYPFSDLHHVVPRAVEEFHACTFALCPNHHRFANLVQAWVIDGVGVGEIAAFAANHFDEPFNTRLLPILLAVRPEGFEVDQIWEMLARLQQPVPTATKED